LLEQSTTSQPPGLLLHVLSHKHTGIHGVVVDVVVGIVVGVVVCVVTVGVVGQVGI